MANKKFSIELNGDTAKVFDGDKELTLTEADKNNIRKILGLGDEAVDGIAGAGIADRWNSISVAGRTALKAFAACAGVGVAVGGGFLADKKYNEGRIAKACGLGGSNEDSTGGGN
ncbi:MAG: hypothetical protein LBR79_01665 [Oscillospiraceae bacterium]|jgi:hypothetical protein|nr:hypothetical protein [Oscillospiraceae bacterium]